ncbi:putative formin-like 1 [Homarus americanus]|uniref:Putative formin-like 1 n=1 Tax=Homarus americanus TaxID=6706 RepID=A0A8J5N5A1_HOMAM|nr:putative formin-like 1 [Homarus americanus]
MVGEEEGEKTLRCRLRWGVQASRHTAAAVHSTTPPRQIVNTAMLKLWVGLGCLLVVTAQRPDFDYVFDYVDSPNFQPLPQAVAGGRPTGNQGPTTTPVPILVDERRIDPQTGAFVYEYAGADGSTKHETRYPNGTVIGNYSFINDLGERESRTYTAGVQDPNHIDETTDPNYVDLGNYDLYKHLEQAYVHEGGSSSFSDQVLSRPPPSAPRPRAQPRPQQAVQRRPQQAVQRRPQPVSAASHFSQPPLPVAGPTFDYEDIGQAPVPVRAPPPPPPPRSRQRTVAPRPFPGPNHRLDLSSTGGQSVDSFLDSGWTTGTRVEARGWTTGTRVEARVDDWH